METENRTSGTEPKSVIRILDVLKTKGYSENLSVEYDRFCCRDGKIKLLPQDFFVDDLIRVENDSDPDEQSIVYAISGFIDDEVIKGAYVESYGLYHEPMSTAMIERIKACRQIHNKILLGTRTT